MWAFDSAVRVVFFFPNGDAGFGFVDDVAAGVEGGSSVGGGDRYVNCHVAYFERLGFVDGGSSAGPP